MTILIGDCREKLADMTWDVMIVDPPYAERVHRKATSCGTPGARKANGMMGAAHRDLGFQHLSPELREWLCQAAARKTKRWSCIFTDVESVGIWKTELEKAGATYIRSVPWIRWSQPQLSGDRPSQGHEEIVLAWGSQKGRKSWNGPGNLTHFAQTCLRGKDKHKAQKPLDLMLDLVEFFSVPGETICDPCAGSGTTALAANLLQREFIGCELDPVWAARASDRGNWDNGTHDCTQYDDLVRWERYCLDAEARKVDKIRMAENTARIRLNREAQEQRDRAKG